MRKKYLKCIANWLNKEMCIPHNRSQDQIMLELIKLKIRIKLKNDNVIEAIVYY